jgi:hypothetical protein
VPSDFPMNSLPVATNRVGGMASKSVQSLGNIDGYGQK